MYAGTLYLLVIQRSPGPYLTRVAPGSSSQGRVPTRRFWDRNAPSRSGWRTRSGNACRKMSLCRNLDLVGAVGLEPTLPKDPDFKSPFLRSWAFLVVQRFPVSRESSPDRFTCVRSCSPALSSKCRQDVARHEGVYVICARRPLIVCCGTAFLGAQPCPNRAARP